jgi:Uma2 family endonuclease
MSDREQLSLHDWFFSILREYLKAFPIAYYIYLETGIRFALPHKVSIRKPDLFVIRNDNPIQYEMPDRTYHGICDLAIESLSDSTQAEIDRDTVVKKQEYAIAGVREYYILDVRHGHTNFYQLAANNRYQPMQPQNGIIYSQVLPGFQFRLEHLIRQPDLIELIDDPVYQSYVMVNYQKQLRMTEAARQEAAKAQQEAAKAQQEAAKAQQEAAKAQQEATVAQEEAAAAKQETERLAAKLREFGIDPD